MVGIFEFGRVMLGIMGVYKGLEIKFTLWVTGVRIPPSPPTIPLIFKDISQSPLLAWVLIKCPNIPKNRPLYRLLCVSARFG